jgi:ribonuclease P protein component
LPRTARLRTPGDFRRVYGRGIRAHGKLIVVVGLPRREPGHRLGVAVSKENGRAVRRNKIKRILREAFRLERPELGGSFDMILIPRPREGRLLLDDVRAELRRLVEQLRAGGRPRGRPRGRRRR